MATGASHQVERVGVFTPKGVAVPELGPGEIGFITAGIKAVADCRVGDTITEDRRPAADAAARLQAGAAGGVLRPVPDRCRRLREAARQPRQAAPQRRQLHLRAGDLGGARLRLPLRLSRAVAPGDHPGAAGARIRPRPDHHGALGRLPGAPDQRPHARPAQPGRHARSGEDRPHRGAVDQGDDLRARRLSRPGPGAVRGAARRAAAT